MRTIQPNRAGCRQRREGRRLDTSAEESRLKLLIGSEAAKIDSRLAIGERSRSGAVVEVHDPVAGNSSSDQSAVITPVESEPWSASPGSLVLQVHGLIKSLVVVDAERKAALSYRHA